MTIVEEIYAKNINISNVELAQEIIKHPALTPLDLWLLPQYPFDEWRRKHDYPKLIDNIKNRQYDFKNWMNEQGITDEYLLSGYLSDFFENKPLSKDKAQHLIRVSHKGEVNLQVWHSYDGSASHRGESVQYEYIKKFISYYDWKLLKNESFSFTNTFEISHPNTINEQAYLNGNVRLLKMGSMRPPTNSMGIILRGKKLEFVNASGLEMHGTLLFADMGNLSFDHSVVDNMKCNELNINSLHFKSSSVKNLQIRNSSLNGWLFVNSNISGNIIDTSVPHIRIFGGQFTPNFINSELINVEVDHDGHIYNRNFEKTYRLLSKNIRDSGNKELSTRLKIKELEFIRKRKKGIKWLFMTIDKIYWEYGQRPKRLIGVAVIAIMLFGVLYSFFPASFKGMNLATQPYWKVLYNTQYYSAVTFTTLGYGDLTPLGPMKLFAAIEALFGAITLGFLVAGLTRND